MMSPNRSRSGTKSRSRPILSAGALRHRIKSLPPDLLFPLDQYGRDQKTHWLRWLSNFEPSHPASRVYNAIQCPHMLVYLAWALDVDRDRFGRALRVFPFDPKELDKNCGGQSRQVRALFPWEEIEDGLSRIPSGMVPALARKMPARTAPPMQLRKAFAQEEESHEPTTGRKCEVGAQVGCAGDPDYEHRARVFRRHRRRQKTHRVPTNVTVLEAPYRAPEGAVHASRSERHAPARSGGARDGATIDPRPVGARISASPWEGP